MTKVYIADTSWLFDEKNFNEAYREVLPYRRAKIDKLRLPKDKRLSLGAELLFKKACIDFDIPYENIKIILNVHGKPSFEEHIKLNFNISHSGTKVMCVMSGYEVGCDVEQVLKPKMKIAKRYFSDSEYEFIIRCHTDTERAQAFYRIWTLKESYIKCTGLGLSLPLKNFSVTSNDIDILSQYCSCDDIYTFFEYDYDDGYRYACCVKNINQQFIPEVIKLNVF